MNDSLEKWEKATDEVEKKQHAYAALDKATIGESAADAAQDNLLLA